MSDNPNIMTRARSRRPRKYGPGEPFKTLDELLDYARAAHAKRSDAFVWREFGFTDKGRVEHVFWTVNTSAIALANLISAARIKRAVITAEYSAWLHDELEGLF